MMHRLGIFSFVGTFAGTRIFAAIHRNVHCHQYMPLVKFHSLVFKSASSKAWIFLVFSSGNLLQYNIKITVFGLMIDLIEYTFYDHIQISSR